MDEQDVTASEFMDYTRQTQDTLRVMAEQTGGLAIVNMNDFDKGLRAIDNATSDYYVLSWYSNNPDPLRRLRKVQISVKRPNTTLGYVPEYTLKPPSKNPVKK
jgi:hypothetical protein